ncbi:uncharacterized protein L969DRAFT_15908 [Mixia osmundae IAM 14324]|uniref:NADH dehydrogenase [ubiquinone] 1 beta subcomplex subunit 9 n=1 Tax=Mixia osmundae (strain CBS 9802 / IAM 14324 / JCM 22182 / KY 12970) TaxID=764103 RepID=G7E638_MIXOS|nr:uncharacterized protein L969DRAFT_15908 [Mixia osmundae IAM 14324]KEI40549.1 hypothetical protein L969DRAFT_15908 [Mixia osmundae IAM 14324]GAA98298.1 hypothetical protein E5Q_04982 [Mixia osmundae IAM 14324]
MPAVTPFSVAHRRYIQLLYRKALKHSLNWYIRRDAWRQRSIEIRAAFESNRHVKDPRAIAVLLADAEKQVAELEHPDPIRPPMLAEGTKWERNIPPKMFSAAEKKEALDAFLHH